MAGVTGPAGSPVVAVGQLQIDFTPLRLPAPAVPAPALPPGAELRIPGLSPFITANAAFYRVDTRLAAGRAR